MTTPQDYYFGIIEHSNADIEVAICKKTTWDESSDFPGEKPVAELETFLPKYFSNTYDDFLETWVLVTGPSSEKVIKDLKECGFEENEELSDILVISC